MCELARKLAETPDQVLPQEIIELVRVLQERFGGALRINAVDTWQREMLL